MAADGRMAGKVALVTGGGSGLGRATARLLAEHGARVVVSDLDAATAKATADGIGPAAIAVQQDVTRDGQWTETIGRAVAAFGGLNVLVNNAGIAGRANIEDCSLEYWRHIHAVDLDSVFLGCKHAIPAMVETIKGQGGSGAIVNLSSIAGIIDLGGAMPYCSAKAAVRHLTKSVALHCARRGYNIRCNSVHPTFIDTPILETARQRLGKEEADRMMLRMIPMGRLGRPIEVAYGILYLASDEASFTTGSELLIDGGTIAQ